MSKQLQLELDLGPVAGDIVEMMHGAIAIYQPPLRCRVDHVPQLGHIDLTVLVWPDKITERTIPRKLLGVPFRCVRVLHRCRI